MIPLCEALVSFLNGIPLYVAEGGGTTYHMAEARRVFAGQPDPKFELGFTNEITWRENWNLAFGVRLIH